MKIIKNVGTADRSIRVILGVLLFAGIGFVDQPIIEWLLLIGSIMLFFTAYIGWCGLYNAFGINTCKVK
jgi:diacylglycerol kinase